MTKVLRVEGMNCAHCVMSVKNALEELKEVRSAVVNIDDSTAAVELSADIDDSALITAVENAGYSVEHVE